MEKLRETARHVTGREHHHNLVTDVQEQRKQACWNSWSERGRGGSRPLDSPTFRIYVFHDHIQVSIGLLRLHITPSLLSNDKISFQIQASEANKVVASSRTMCICFQEEGCEAGKDVRSHRSISTNRVILPDFVQITVCQHLQAAVCKLFACGVYVYVYLTVAMIYIGLG